MCTLHVYIYNSKVTYVKVEWLYISHHCVALWLDSMSAVQATIIKKRGRIQTSRALQLLFTSGACRGYLVNWLYLIIDMDSRILYIELVLNKFNVILSL